MRGITNSEWNVLYSQLINSGKDKWIAGEIIRKHKQQFKQLKVKLESKYSEKDAETKFKEEFEKLYQGMEE